LKNRVLLFANPRFAFLNPRFAFPNPRFAFLNPVFASFAGASIQENGKSRLLKCGA
jgi:hypothetical protein